MNYRKFIMYHWKNILFIGAVLFGWTAGASLYAQLSEADRELLEVVADESLDSGEICNLAFGLILVDGANVDTQRESDGFTALHIAAERGLNLLVTGLVRAGARIGTEDVEGRTARQLAEAAGQAEILAVFTDMENPDEQRHYDVFNLADQELFDVIFDLELTEEDVCNDAFGLVLLDDANVNAVDPELGNSPLHLAATVGHELLVQGLIRAGANLGVRNVNRLSPVDIAALNGRAEVAVALAQAGADLTGYDFHGMTPLHVAAQAGHVHMIAPLLGAGVQLEAQDYRGRTALYYAVREGQLGMAQELMDFGAGLYAVDPAVGGGTPLHVAVRQGDLGVAEYFIRLGADMNALDDAGFFAYGRARLIGREDFVQLFEDRGYLADEGFVPPEEDVENEPSFGEEEIQACRDLLADQAAREEDRRLNRRRRRIQRNEPTRVRRTSRFSENVGLGDLDCLTSERSRKPFDR